MKKPETPYTPPKYKKKVGNTIMGYDPIAKKLGSYGNEVILETDDGFLVTSFAGPLQKIPSSYVYFIGKDTVEL